jgi:hypothetical protein
MTADAPGALLRLIDAACSYAAMYRPELEIAPEGGTSRELLDAVDEWRGGYQYWTRDARRNLDTGSER